WGPGLDHPRGAGGEGGREPPAARLGVREAGPGEERMSFVGLTPAEEQEMLREVGVERFEALHKPIPAAALLDRPLRVGGPLSEIELRRQFSTWSRANDADRMVSFL